MDSAPQQTNSKWETFDTAFASWMELYSNREFTEICSHVSNVGMAELVPGYGSTCEKALEYKQGQPFVRYIGDPEYADWAIADTNVADEETMRAAGEFQVSTLPAGKGQETADIHQYKWWVRFENGWDHGIGAVFAYEPDDGWVIVDVK